MHNCTKRCATYSHPLDPYARKLKQLGIKSVADVTASLMPSGAWDGGGNGQPVFAALIWWKLAGVVLDFEERITARGNRFAQARLSDTSGAFLVTVFSEQLAAAHETLESGRLVVIAVKARIKDGHLRMAAQHIQALEEGTYA